MFKSLNNKKGFTLVESAVAMMVLLIAIITIMQFFPLGIKIIGDSQSQTVASNIAVTRIEELRALNYEDLATGTIETKSPVSSDPTNFLNRYQRETVVELVDDNFDPAGSDLGLKKITVNVYWQSPVISEERRFRVEYVTSDY